MVEVDVSNGESFVLDKPERGAKEGYLMLYFNKKTQMGRIITESNGLSDHRLRLFTLNLISDITDDGLREEAFKYFNERITKINSNAALDAVEKNQAIADFCVGEMQGHITSFYDQFLGISHRITVGKI